MLCGKNEEKLFVSKSYIINMATTRFPPPREWHDGVGNDKGGNREWQKNIYNTRTTHVIPAFITCRHPQQGGDLVLSVLIGILCGNGEEKLFVFHKFLIVCWNNQIPASAGMTKMGWRMTIGSREWHDGVGNDKGENLEWQKNIYNPITLRVIPNYQYDPRAL